MLFPGPIDLALGAYLRAAWAQLMYTGKLDPATTGGWKSIEQVDGFPAHYGVQRISCPDLVPYEPTAFMTDYKADVCATLASYGFDQRFWWVD